MSQRPTPTLSRDSARAHPDSTGPPEFGRILILTHHQVGDINNPVTGEDAYCYKYDGVTDTTTVVRNVYQQANGINR